MVEHDLFLENSSQGEDFKLTTELSKKAQYSRNHAIKAT